MQPTGRAPALSPEQHRTGNHPRDLARAALDAGTAPAEVADLAATCRALRLQGVGHEEVAALLATAGKVTDLSTILGVRDHVWRVGDPDPLPAAPVAVMPEIDVDDLFGGSPVAAVMARWVSGEVVCGPDLPVLTILALFSAACAVKVVGCAGGWHNPPSLFLGVEVQSGENKTRVRKECGGRMLSAHGKVVGEWHDVLRSTLGGGREDARIEKKIKEAALAKLIAGGGDPIARADLGVEIAKLDEELKKKPVSTPGWLQEGKITPEQFVRDMQLGGFVAVYPDEGKETLWKFVGGDGKQAGDLAPLLCAFSGEPCNNATIASEQRGDLRRFSDFRAAMFLPLQLGVLTPTTPEDGKMLANLGERGLLARLLIARPRPVRSDEAPGVRARHAAEFGNADVVATILGSYRALLAAVLHANGQASEAGDGIPERQAEEAAVGAPHPLVPANPWLFVYTPEAVATLLAYQTATRDSAKAGGPNSAPMLAEFVSRLADHAHRLATLLAVMRAGGIEGGGTVEVQDVERAIRFLDGYALPHTRGVYERATFAPIADDAETVLRIVRNAGEITKREILARLPHSGRQWEKAKASDRQTRLEVALETLDSRGVVVLHPMAKNVLVRYVRPAA